MAIAVVTVLSLSIPAFAAETANTAGDATASVTIAPAETAVLDGENGPGYYGVMPLNTVGWCTTVGGIGGTYKQVAAASSGFNCTVRLTMSVPAGYKIDVAMYSGNTKVWEETNAFNGSREFWCGNNVTAIYVRVTDITGFPPMLNSYTCGVDVFGS